ncbi:MAG: hypothetical protein Q4D21_01600 [Phascolarctobacterium sp.]|nr:hypothetical protein [Phascolarctobacterium sp.]
MDFHQIVNLSLYAFSGIMFGIFAARQTLQASIKIREAFKEAGFAGLVTVIPSLLIVLITLFIFPSIFTTRTQLGGFTYYLTLIYFFNKGWKIYRNK